MPIERRASLGESCSTAPSLCNNSGFQVAATRTGLFVHYDYGVDFSEPPPFGSSRVSFWLDIVSPAALQLDMCATAAAAGVESTIDSCRSDSRPNVSHRRNLARAAQKQ